MSGRSPRGSHARPARTPGRPASRAGRALAPRRRQVTFGGRTPQSHAASCARPLDEHPPASPGSAARARRRRPRQRASPQTPPRARPDHAPAPQSALEPLRNRLGRQRARPAGVWRRERERACERRLAAGQRERKRRAEREPHEMRPTDIEGLRRSRRARTRSGVHAERLGCVHRARRTRGRPTPTTWSSSASSSCASHSRWSASPP